MNRSAPPISGGEGADPHAERLTALSAHLGVEMPPFEGPLAAFQLEGHRGAEDPVFLGGDLHAVHPSAGGPAAGADRDPTLYNAILTIADHDHEMLDFPAVEGVWCTRIEGERLPASPYFSLIDSEGRIRVWLLLPPPRLLVGIAHFWLPSVPPPDDPRTDGHGRPSLPARP